MGYGMCRRLAPYIALLLVAVLAMTRGLVAPGYMLAGPADGELLRVVICTGNGERLVTLDQDGQPVEPEPGGSFADPCAFAMQGPLAYAEPSRVTEPSRDRQPIRSTDRDDQTRFWRPIGPTWPRGPPDRG